MGNVSLKEVIAKVEEYRTTAISSLASKEGIELYRSQGDYRTLEWFLGLPDQILAEREQRESNNQQEDDGPEEY